MPNTALFKGATSYPLSEEEKKAFFDRLELTGRNFTFGSDRRKMRKALESVLETPTGREQAREIINYEPKDHKFKIDSSQEDSINPDHTAAYIPKEDYIGIRPKFLDDQSELGQVLFHELMHARQPMSENASRVICDTETQALSSQLSMELNIKNGNNSDPSYDKSFEINKKKWLNIAKNPAETPKGALRFEPVDGLSKTDLAKAQEEYATQMASLETRSQYIKDFLKSSQRFGIDKSALPEPSYNNFATALAYQGEDDTAFLDENNLSIVPEMKQQLKDKYLGIDDSDFKDLEKRLKQDKDIVPWHTDFADKNALVDIKAKGKILVSERFLLNKPFRKEGQCVINALKDVKEPNLQKILTKYKNNDELSDEESNKLIFEYMKRDNGVNKDLRIQEMSRIIANYQTSHPEDKAELTQMIHDLEKVAGHKMPIPQNTNQQSNGLNARLKMCAELVPEGENNQDNTNAYIMAQSKARIA